MELGPQVSAMENNLYAVWGHRLGYPRIVHHCGVCFTYFASGDRFWGQDRWKGSIRVRGGGGQCMQAPGPMLTHASGLCPHLSL